MAPEVAEALARLGQRERWTGDDDLVFPRRRRQLPRRARRCSSATSAALERAGLRPLRFHDLRHTFGTRMIGKADIRRVQEWMGHADVADDDASTCTTCRAPTTRVVAAAFSSDQATRAGRHAASAGAAQRSLFENGSPPAGSFDA